MNSNELLTWVPHRPPMLWIDEVLGVTPEEGKCRVVLKPDALYREDGKVLPTSCIEWVAQAFACVRSVHQMDSNLLHQRTKHQALLVGVRNAEFLFEIGDPEVEAAEDLIVTVSDFREYGPIIMVHGEVHLSSGRLLMQGNLRVYHTF